MENQELKCYAVFGYLFWKPLIQLKAVLAFPSSLTKGATINMTNILRLPHEVLSVIFGFVDAPKNLSMTCRSIKEFSQDPAVICSWFLGGDPVYRASHCHRLIFEMRVLERLVCLFGISFILV